VNIQEIGDSLKKQYQDLYSNSAYPLPENSWEWVEALSSVDRHQLSGVAWEENGTLLAAVPAFIKRSSIGSIMMSIPFPDTYGGVIVRIGVDIELAYSIILRGLVEQAVRRGASALEIGQSVFRSDLELYLQYLQPDEVVPVSYEYTELGTDPFERLTSHRRYFRRRLQKAYETGVTISTTTDLDILKQWYHEILRSRYNDIGGKLPRFKLYQAVFERLQPKGMAKLFCAWQNTYLIGGGMLLLSRFSANMYERTVVTNALKTGACVLLDYCAINAAIQHGCKYYDWAYSPTPGVRQYKEQWGALGGIRYHFVKLISVTMNRFLEIREAIGRESPHYFG
jgi:predicted N-acyltransferase